MSRFFFCNVAGFSHVNPTLPIVFGLVMQGHEVIYCITDEFKEMVEAVGAQFLRYESIIDTGVIRIPPTMEHRPLSNIPELCEALAVLPQLIPTLRELQPDCIFYDYKCFWGYLLAQSLHIPAVKYYGTFPCNQYFTIHDYYNSNFLHLSASLGAETTVEQMQDIERLSTLCSIPTFDYFDYRFQCEPLNIVLMPRALHPAGESFDERFLFIGASLRTPSSTRGWTARLRPGMPTVYISLGTLINNWPEFYRMCLKAFQEPTFQVVLSIGPKVDPRSLGRIPSHIIVAASVPQLDVLKQTDVFISHGGTNSVMEALFYGVPMLVIPRNLENALFAQRIAALKLGLMVEKQQVTPQRLYEGAKILLHDQEIKDNIQTMRQTMREAGGAQRAVEAIIQYASHTW